MNAKMINCMFEELQRLKLLKYNACSINIPKSLENFVRSINLTCIGIGSYVEMKGIPIKVPFMYDKYSDEK